MTVSSPPASGKLNGVGAGWVVPDLLQARGFRAPPC